MAAIRYHGAVRNDAASHTIRSSHGVSGAAAGHRVIGAAVVIDLNELVVCATWTTHTEFTDDQLPGCCRHCERSTRKRSRRDDQRPAIEGSRIYRRLIRSKHPPRTLSTRAVHLVQLANRLLRTK